MTAVLLPTPPHRAPPRPTWQYPFHSTVEGTQVWLAEVPITRKLKILTDGNGRWDLAAVKLKGVPLDASSVYERASYVTTKVPVLTIGDADITDLAKALHAFCCLAAHMLSTRFG